MFDSHLPEILNKEFEEVGDDRKEERNDSSRNCLEHQSIHSREWQVRLRACSGQLLISSVALSDFRGI